VSPPRAALTLVRTYGFKFECHGLYTLVCVPRVPTGGLPFKAVHDYRNRLPFKTKVVNWAEQEARALVAGRMHPQPVPCI
jgi:hypothetical protein